MKASIASALLIAASFYAFFGICPMQVSMMSGESTGMETMQHAMDSAVSGANQEMVSMQKDAAPCSMCVMAIDQFALRESEVLEKANTVVLELQDATQMLQSLLVFDRTEGHLTIVSRGNSPPSYLASINTIVLRT